MKFNKTNIWILFAYYSLLSFIPACTWTVGIMDPVRVWRFHCTNSEMHVCFCLCAPNTQQIEFILQTYKSTVPQSTQCLHNSQSHTIIIIIAPKSYYYLREWFSLCFSIVCDRIDQIVIQHKTDIDGNRIARIPPLCVPQQAIDHRLWHSDRFHTKYNLWILIVIAMNYVNGI